MEIGDEVIVKNIKTVVEITDDSCVLSDGITYLKRNIIPINDIPIESDLIKAHRIKDLEIPYFDKDEKSKSTWVTLYVYVNVENGNVVNVKIK